MRTQHARHGDHFAVQHGPMQVQDSTGERRRIAVPLRLQVQIVAARAPGNILSLSGGAPVQGAGRKQQRCYRQGERLLSYVRVAQHEPLKTPKCESGLLVELIA